jgi:hypothetical protein
VVQPVVATVIDTVGALTNEVTGAVAPVEAAVQPVLATVVDTVGTLTNEVTGAVAPVEAAVQPVVATVIDTVGTLTNEVAGVAAPIEAVASTLLAAGTGAAQSTVSDASSLDGPILTDVIAAASSELQTIDTLQDSATLAPLPGSDIDPSSQGVADTSKVVAHHIGSGGLVSGTVTKVLPDIVDVLQPGEPHATGDFTHHAVASVAPVVETADPLLVAMTEAASHPVSPDASGQPHSTASSSHATVALQHGSDATGEVTQPGNLASDTIAHATPVVGTTEPVLTATAAVLSNPVTSDTHSNGASVVDTSEPVLASAGVSPSDPGTALLHLAGVDTGTSQASGSADTLFALATATDAPIEVSESATSGAANGGSNAAGAIDPVAGDVIALNDAPKSPINTLFTGTHYTEYGVTLSSIVVQPQHAGAAAETALTEVTSVSLVADVSQHSQSTHEMVDTTHSIDHLGLRDAIL